MEESNNNLERELEECRRAYRKRTTQFTKLLKQSKEMTANLRLNFDGIVYLLGDIITQASPIMGGHTKRTAALARSISQAMRLNPDRRRLVFYAASLHDLSLTGREQNWLDEENRDWLDHPDRSADLIAVVKNLGRIAATVRSHHEYYNGEGFPRGLRGEEIPLESRIITAALSYDRSVALRKIPVDTTLESMEAGGRFDPQVLEHLSSIIRSEDERRRRGDRLILLEELTPGMELADDLILANGLVLYPRGTILDEETRTRIINFDGMFPESGLIRVYGAGQ
ncbi:HD domain-containing phosphohydrolase [Marispirochaeta aestuarii]|uniref:HD-GYP domain-containing protein n=1 Tax=Marispirochaeta aestuarii TaxID=1963862 RepID=UPI002ABD3C96|nr:HD domain-containing phosphohydrolase [Marispirochaeta aestuarii]